jgi:hypothetical protein
MKIARPHLVVPAKAGTHEHGPEPAWLWSVFMDSGLRRNDEAGGASLDPDEDIA